MPKSLVPLIFAGSQISILSSGERKNISNRKVRQHGEPHLWQVSYSITFVFEIIRRLLCCSSFSTRNVNEEDSS